MFSRPIAWSHIPSWSADSRSVVPEAVSETLFIKVAMAVNMFELMSTEEGLYVPSRRHLDCASPEYDLRAAAISAENGAADAVPDAQYLHGLSLYTGEGGGDSPGSQDGCRDVRPRRIIGLPSRGDCLPGAGGQ